MEKDKVTITNESEENQEMLKATKLLLETMQKIIPEAQDFSLIVYSKDGKPGAIKNIHITGRGDPQDQLSALDAAERGIVREMRREMEKMGFPPEILNMAEEMAERHAEIIDRKEDPDGAE